MSEFFTCAVFEKGGWEWKFILCPTDAVKQVTMFMGMQPCERTDRVDPTKSSHTLLLAGVFRGGHDVLVKARLAEGQGVTMKITVRSTDLGVCEIVASSVA